jgi:hypothetical protein
MNNYLAVHPEIGMGPKEVHHLAGDDYWRLFGAFRGDTNISRERYLELFSHLTGKRRIGEASVWYLYSSTAARAIADFDSAAQVIVMLRNPLEMIPSLHAMLRFIGIEPVADFAAALALDPERERSGGPPGFPSSSYRRAADFAPQLQRYLDVFPADRVRVVLYDDVQADLATAYRDLTSFLGVDSSFLPEFDVVNANRRSRSRMVQRALVAPPPIARRIVHSIMPSHRARSAVRNRITEWNTRPSERAALDAPTRHALERIAAEQAAALGPLLDRDLSAWMDPPR